MNVIDFYARNNYAEGIRFRNKFDEVKADHIINGEAEEFVPKRRKYEIFFENF